MRDYKEYRVNRESTLGYWADHIGSYDTLQEALIVAKEATTDDWENWDEQSPDTNIPCRISNRSGDILAIVCYGMVFAVEDHDFLGTAIHDYTHTIANEAEMAALKTLLETILSQFNLTLKAKSQENE